MIKTDEPTGAPDPFEGKKHQIFVYGTLKKEHGGSAHDRFMGDGTFIGKCSIPGVMVHLGMYPGLVPDEICRVTGEVWEVEAKHIRDMDGYEGCPHNYNRRRIMTPLGICWVYYKNGMPGQIADATVCVDRGLWLGGKIDRMPYHKVKDYYKNKRWMEPAERLREWQPIVPTVIPESSPNSLLHARAPQLNLATGEVIGGAGSVSGLPNNVVPIKPALPVVVVPPIQVGPGTGVM